MISMSATTTIPQRYMPIPQDYQVINGAFNITTYTQEANTSGADLSGGVLGAFYQDLSLVLSLAIMIIIAAIIVIYMLSITSLPRIPSRSVEISRRISGDQESVDSYGSYSYDGVKLVLRKIYLGLRRSSGCGRCTPRELVLRGYAPADFADVYEDIVYGDIERSDADRVVEKAKEILGGDVG